MSTFRPGDKVLVARSSADPIELEMRPNAVVAEVLPGGHCMVWHPDVPAHLRRKYGPIPPGRISRGWDVRGGGR